MPKNGPLAATRPATLCAVAATRTCRMAFAAASPSPKREMACACQASGFAAAVVKRRDAASRGVVWCSRLERSVEALSAVLLVLRLALRPFPRAVPSPHEERKVERDLPRCVERDREQLAGP